MLTISRFLRLRTSRTMTLITRQPRSMLVGPNARTSFPTCCGHGTDLLFSYLTFPEIVRCDPRGDRVGHSAQGNRASGAAVTASRLRTMRRTAGALLALLAFGAAWPSAAQAGCLYPHGAALGHEGAHLDRLALAGALSAPIDEVDPPAPMPTCTGLRCSNEPAPTAPAVAPVAKPCGDLANLASNPDTTSSPWPSDDPAVRPRHRGASPFHPPR